MTQKDKELLFKDLCARMPYGVMCHIKGEKDAMPLHSCITDIYAFDFKLGENSYLTFRIVDEIKPYLFPLSSMTEKQRNDISKLLIDTQKEYSPYGELNMRGCDNLFICTVKQANVLINYCLTHHLDINGLIEKDLLLMQQD